MRKGNAMMAPPITPKNPIVEWLDPKEVKPENGQDVLFIYKSNFTGGGVIEKLLLGYFSDDSNGGKYLASSNSVYSANTIRLWSPAPEVPKEVS